MTLIAFTPILWVIKNITVLPWIGEVNHALVWVAIISALGGTFILATVRSNYLVLNMIYKKKKQHIEKS